MGQGRPFSGGEDGWAPAGLASPWPSWGAGGPPGGGVKLPFVTEGLLLEGAFRAQLGGVSGRPWTCSAQARDPPHHLPPEHWWPAQEPDRPGA